MVLLHPEDPLGALTTISTGDLPARPLISYGSHAGIGLERDAAFRAASIIREVALEVASSVAAVPLVQAGLGAAVVDGLAHWEPSMVAHSFSPRIALRLYASTDNAPPMPRLAEPSLEMFGLRSDAAGNPAAECLNGAIHCPGGG